MNTFFAWGLSQGANALNVLAGIIIAHIVSPYEFSRFATLSAALTIMSAVLNPMVNEIAQRVARDQAITLTTLRTRTIFAITACCTVAICACASIVTGLFEATLTYILIPVLLVGQSWATGFFYGLHRVIAVGAILCTSSVMRVVSLLGFLHLGVIFGGIALSYLTGFIVTVIISQQLLLRHWRAAPEEEHTTNWKLLCGFFLLALPFSVDQPIVQAIFPDSAADYAALMTYARSVMLLAGPALTLVYSASLQRQSGQQQRRHAGLLPSLPIAAGLAGGLALALWFSHPLLFPLLLGSKYIHVTTHLSLALLGMTFSVIAYFLIQRLLLSCTWLLCATLAIPPLVQAVLLVSFSAPSIAQLTMVSVVTFTLQCVIAIGATYIDWRGART
jgi:hypothetical protein